MCEKYCKLLKSSIGLGFFKNYHKVIKAICKENEKDFQCWAFLSFKTKPVTQVFFTDIQAKIWKSLYAFIFVSICIYFSVYKFLSCMTVKECIKNQLAFYRKYRLIEIAWEFLQTRMQNFETNLLKSILIQIWKSFSIYSNSYEHNALKTFQFLSQEFLSCLPVKFVYFVKSRLFLTSREFLRFKTRNFLSIVFTWTRIYREIFWVLFLHEHEYIGKFFEYCFYMNTNI